MKARPRAPGPDGIHNLLKHLTEDILKILKKILDKIWTSANFPDQRRALIPIPKPNKDHTNPLNYWPITLTSCLCKVLERMIVTRFTWYLGKSRILGRSQCGLRKHRSTIDHLVSQERYPQHAFVLLVGLLWLGDGLWNNLVIWYHPRQNWPQGQTAFLPLSPPGWRGIVTVRPGGRLPNLRNSYLCNRLMDFLHSKYCGIV